MDAGRLSKAKAKYDSLGEKFAFSDHLSYGKRIKDSLVNFLKSAPIIAMVWEGEAAVALIRKLVGATEPAGSAPRHDPRRPVARFLRAFQRANPTIRNLVHASGNAKEAEYEIPIWFTDVELHKYEHVNDRVQYDILLGSCPRNNIDKIEIRAPYFTVFGPRKLDVKQFALKPSRGPRVFLFRTLTKEMRMAVLLLGYVNDPVVLETFGAVIGCRFGNADYESVFEEVPNEFSNLGTIRSGRLTYSHVGRKIKRVVLAFLNPSVTAARVIDRLGFAPAKAVLVATARAEPIKRVAERRRHVARICRFRGVRAVNRRGKRVFDH